MSCCNNRNALFQYRPTLLVGRVVSSEEKALGRLRIMDPQTICKSEFTSSLAAPILQHGLSFDGGVLDAQHLASSVFAMLDGFQLFYLCNVFAVRVSPPIML